MIIFYFNIGYILCYKNIKYGKMHKYIEIQDSSGSLIKAYSKYIFLLNTPTYYSQNNADTIKYFHCGIKTKIIYQNVTPN